MDILTTRNNRSRRTCYGVTVEIDENDAGSQEVAQAFDTLNDHFALAIQGARQTHLTDRGRRATYRVATSPLLKASGAPAPATSQGVSLLDDCGLPVVGLFGDFLSGFLDHEVSTANLPFVGLARGSFSPLWAPPIIAQIIGINFGGLFDYYESVHYLTRINSNDTVWQGPQQHAWFRTFGSGLTGYVTDLFSGRFVDRNGTGVSFNLQNALGGVLKIDQKQVAPQLAGAIVSALCEFLGDQLYQVPFSSSEILESYRDFRDKKASGGGTLTMLKTLTDAVQNGTISEADAAALLGIPKGGGNLPVVFDKIRQGATESPVVASGVARMVLRKIDQLDSDYLTGLLGVAPLSAALDSIEGNQSDLQTRFTCFKTGVIQNNLVNLFIPDPRPGKQGVLGRDHDTGRLTGDTTDYSDLLGRLVAFGATTAEKSVRSLVGGLIRGVAIASLQNEVMAELVASLAGTLAKKLVESLTYQALRQFIDAPGTDPDAKRAVLNALARFHGASSALPQTIRAGNESGGRRKRGHA